MFRRFISPYLPKDIKRLNEVFVTQAFIYMDFFSDANVEILKFSGFFKDIFFGTIFFV